MMLVLQKFPFLLVLALLGSISGFAQNPPDPNYETGKLYDSYHGGNIDDIRLAQGGLAVDIPLIAYSQRGGKLKLAFVLHYHNNGSFADSNCGQYSCILVGTNLDNGFAVIETGLASGIVECPTLLTGKPSYGCNATVSKADGEVHVMQPVGATTWRAVDSSGYRLDTAPGGLPSSSWLYVTDPDGTRYSSGGPSSTTSVVEDTNGNQITLNGPPGFESSWIDTMGRNIPAWASAYNAAFYSYFQSGATGDTSGCTGSLPALLAFTWNPPGVNGGAYPLKFCIATLSVTPPFQIIGAINFTYVIQSVVLPDTGGTWTFQYTSDGNGDLAQITFPAGGTLSYTWTSPPAIANTHQNIKTRGIATRTLNPNDGTSPSGTWRYSFGIGGGPAGTFTNAVTDPAGNDTTHNFTFLSATSPYETLTKSYQGSSTSGALMRTVQTDYSFGPAASCVAYSNNTNVVPIRVTTIWPSGLQSKVEHDYGGAFTFFSCSDFDTHGNINAGPGAPGIYGREVAVREYGFGTGAAGSLLRSTSTPHLALANGNQTYLNNNLLNLLSSVTISDQGGNASASLTFGYDAPNLHSPGSTIQHDSNPPAGSVRGNLTSVGKWLNTTNTTLTSTEEFFDTGVPQKSADPLGHTTTYAYDSAYAGAYVTQTCLPQTGSVTHCTGAAYDFNAGLTTSLTDQNNQTSTYSYDSLGRMLSQVLPIADSSGVHPETDFAYPDTTTVKRIKKQDASHTIVDYVYFDGLGRTKQTRLVDPQGDDFVDTTYDAVGRVSTVSNPHRATASSTDGITTYLYDALGRVTNLIPPDGTASGDNVITDYSTFPAVTVTDQAGNQRRSTSDAKGRLIEVDEPGSSYSGVAAGGSLGVSGTLQSTVVGAANAIAGSGSVTITGSEGSVTTGGGSYCAMWNNTGDCVDWEIDPPTTTYDWGTVTITVNGHADNVSYGSGSNANSVASALASAINADGGAFINASAANGVLYLTARQTGAGGNYSWSISHASSDAADFGSGGSFGGSPASGTLSGGTNGSGGTTVYDQGTVTVTIGSFSASVAYGHSGNNTASLVAIALGTALNGSNSPVTVPLVLVQTATLDIVYKAVGASGNVAVACNSSTSQGTYFSSPSFACPGITLSGGADPVPSSLSNPFVTLYSYDALGDLLRVDQKGSAPSDSTQWRTRLFTYDSLSRLLTAQNPESGTISYSYDADGNLLQKTSPAPNQTGSATQTISYCYDALNRVTGRIYTAQSCPLTSPAVSYTYDASVNGVGHMTSLTDQAGSGSYSYDALGRVASEQRTISGFSKTVSYEYNLDSSLKVLHYPSGAMITYTPNSAGRMLAAVDTGNGINYVTGAIYGPDGRLTGFVSGNTGSFAGITNAFSYNKRFQPINMSASSPSQTVFSVGYDFHVGNGDNGNVWGITNYKDSSRNQSFTYDALNRLTSAQNAGTNCAATTVNGKTEYWGNSYGYDAWGNLLSKTVTKCSAENLSVTAAANNQLQGGYTYDAAGNMTHDATANLNYSYDQENRITGAGGFTYTYDGDGNRVEKSNGSTGTLYWYMSPGIVAESDLAGNPQSEYVFFDGEHVARKDFPGLAVSYYFSDHLKTASVITDAAGNIKSESDYYPWGGELQFTNNDSNHFKFTGKMRDSESNLDYFGARFYSSALGRFVTPDEAGADQHPLLPQTWNLYTYGRNNPLLFVDPTGQYVCGSSMTPTQCTDFQTGLNNAQNSANVLKDKYGADSTQYKDAQRAIDAYGAAGAKNGVTIEVGATRSGGGAVEVANYKVDRTDANPTGQKITVTFTKAALGDAALEGHEGSHVADGSAWVKSAFNPSLNPTRYVTEYRAFQVQANLQRGAGYMDGGILMGGKRYPLFCCGGNQFFQDFAIRGILAAPKADGGLYGLTKQNQGGKQFTPFTPY